MINKANFCPYAYTDSRGNQRCCGNSSHIGDPTCRHAVELFSRYLNSRNSKVKTNNINVNKRVKRR